MPPAPPLPVIDKSKFVLPTEQYVPEPVLKSGIVLHHTVSGPKVKSVYDWWLEKGQTKKVRVGTAYVIGLDGQIYEFFPDNCWAWHLGKGNSNAHERRTIGIELISAGPLERLEENSYRTFFGTKHSPEKVVSLRRNWRGYQYFDKYTDTQMISTVELVYYLCDKYGIPRQIKDDLWTYSEGNKTFEGIYTHAQVRPDKTDVHPKFPINYLARWAQLRVV